MYIYTHTHIYKEISLEYLHNIVFLKVVKKSGLKRKDQ